MTVEVDNEVLVRLKDIARKRGKPIHMIVGDALALYYQDRQRMVKELKH